MRADARVEAHAVDDLARVQALRLGVGVELVEVGDAQCQIRVGEQLHGLGLGEAHEQRVDVLLDGPLLQQLGERLGRLDEMPGLRGGADPFVIRSSGSVPTTMRLGYRLSYSALDSRRNSGLKMMFLEPVFSRIDLV